MHWVHLLLQYFLAHLVSRGSSELNRCIHNIFLGPRHVHFLAQRSMGYFVKSKLGFMSIETNEAIHGYFFKFFMKT